ncbi:hypothetical protein BH11BAC3_BH11BAC3_07630 [soil metagenome]
METGNKYDDVLIRYLLNEVNAQEEKFVTEWRHENEENDLYLESLANTINLVAVNNSINKINIEQEWQHFTQLKSAGEQSGNDKEAQGNYQSLDIAGPVQSRTKVYRILFAGAIAASILVLLFLKLGFFDSNKNGLDTAVENSEVSSSSDVLVYKINTTNHIQSFKLPDGTIVNLYSKSELTYREPANHQNRLVSMVGKADFKVAKDPSKPFSVMSDPISTTAIGTQFTVTAIPNENRIYVHLTEGKVVVKDELSIRKKKMADVYLLPGQVLIFDRLKGTALVKSFNEKGVSKSGYVAVQRDNPMLPTDKRKSWFMFNNQPLAEILKTLETLYDSKIEYSNDEINKMYFIGTFNKSDSLEFILKQIASINNLEVSRDNDTYIIKKIVKK